MNYTGIEKTPQNPNKILTGFNKVFVVQDKALSKNNCTQYAHSNSISRI